MSLVRSKNTSPEKLVFTFLRTSGIYHQRHYTRAPGKPDIALPRKKRAVFIDGDFWHGRDYARLKHTMPAYWVKKLARTIERDRLNRKLLVESGWSVLVIWESDLMRKRTAEATLRRIKDFLTK